MDKYEYRVRTEQMLEYMENKSYDKAMEIADTIDWRRVKNASMLSSVSEIYEFNGEYQKSRDILFIAYDRSPGSRKIVYRLGILALKLNDINEATDCYEEFVALAPKDPNQYILRYKILKSQRAPIEQQIEALEDFKKAEYVEKWAYELAKLYHDAGMTAECLEECDDLILWFSEGKYVYQAMELKMRYKPLTPLQQEKFNHRYDTAVNTSAFKKAARDTKAQVQPESEEQEEEMPKLKKPEFKKPEFRKPDIKTTVTGATLAEALANGVAFASSEKSDDEDSYEEAELSIEDNYEEAELPAEEENYEEAELPDEEEYEEDVLVSEDEENYEEATLPVEEEQEVKLAESPKPPVIEPEEEQAVAGQITGQMKIEEILQNWEAKQKEVQKEIKEKKEEAEQERETITATAAEKAADNLEDILNGLNLDDLDGSSEESELPANEEEYEEIVFDRKPEEEEYQEVTFDKKPEEEEYEEIRFDTASEEDSHEESYEEEVFEEEPEEEEMDYEEAYEELEDSYEEEFLDEYEEEDDYIEEEQETEPEPDEEEEEEVDLQRLLEENDEDYKKPSKGRGPYDTGFVVQGRYDLSATSEIGLKAGLTEEQKKLFSYFVPVRGMSEQLVEVLAEDKACKSRYGTSRTGNLMIVGRKGSGKTVLAVDVVKAIQKQRKLKQAKVAIVSGDALNQKALSGVIGKLYGGAVIIEKAGKMNSRTVEELNDLMEEQTGELYVVLEDQRKPLEALMKSNPEFKKKFTSKLELPIFINDELVTFGQTYAKENGYKIDEMGILALYSRIDMMQREDHAVTVAEVKEIMDEAIEHSQKGNVKHLMKRVFGKNADESDRIYLHEDDF